MSQRTKVIDRELFQYDFLDEVYAGDAVRVGRYGFPQLQRVTAVAEVPALSINYLLSAAHPEETWFHCFCADEQFERLWKNFYGYLPALRGAKGIISTDFSLYRGDSPALLVRNCKKNRVMAYAMQKNGVNVIPTAGFGPEWTWEWCFDGLCPQSTVAVTTNGVLSDPEACRLFRGGIAALIRCVDPPAIIVCGPCPSGLISKYSKVEFVHIPNYSQLWRERRWA